MFVSRFQFVIQMEMLSRQLGIHVKVKSEVWTTDRHFEIWTMARHLWQEVATDLYTVRRILTGFHCGLVGLTKFLVR